MSWMHRRVDPGSHCPIYLKCFGPDARTPGRQFMSSGLLLQASSRSIARTPPRSAAEIEIWTGHCGERTWEDTTIRTTNGCWMLLGGLAPADFSQVTVEAKSIATQLQWPCNAFSSDFQQVPSTARTSASNLNRSNSSDCLEFISLGALGDLGKSRAPTILRQCGSCSLGLCKSRRLHHCTTVLVRIYSQQRRSKPPSGGCPCPSRHCSLVMDQL